MPQASTVPLGGRIVIREPRFDRAPRNALHQEHADILARHLAKQLAVPVEVKLIARNSGPSKRLLSRIQRFRRTQDLFRWQRSRRLKPLDGLHVAIVDDVITTGSTIREIGKTLRCQGAVRIDAWCATRPPRKTI